MGRSSISARFASTLASVTLVKYWYHEHQIVGAGRGADRPSADTTESAHRASAPWMPSGPESVRTTTSPAAETTAFESTMDTSMAGTELTGSAEAITCTGPPSPGSTAIRPSPRYTSGAGRD